MSSKADSILKMNHPDYESYREGTGSFGNAVLKRFLNTDIKEIRIFSRDEKKQDDMRHDYQARYPEYAKSTTFAFCIEKYIDTSV